MLQVFRRRILLENVFDPDRYIFFALKGLRQLKKKRVGKFRSWFEPPPPLALS